MNDQEKQSVSQTLRGAADYIEAHGWYQGDYFDQSPEQKGNPFPPVCALGAIGMAVFGDKNQIGAGFVGPALEMRHAMIALATWLDSSLYDEDLDRSLVDESDVADWNDDDLVDASEVVAVLRAAADDNDPALIGK